jgi:hypothetical protein
VDTRADRDCRTGIDIRTDFVRKNPEGVDIARFREAPDMADRQLG